MPVSSGTAPLSAAASASPPTAASAERVRLRAWLSPLAGLLLVAATLHYVDAGAVAARFSELRFGYILLGAALTLPQLYCVAARWRMTAARVSGEHAEPLSQRRALREYALSMLLNQLLPFGVAGDAVRVVRHKQRGAHGGSTSYSTALYGVMLERAIGQLVVIAWALAALPLWFGKAGAALAGAAIVTMGLIAVGLRRLSVPALNGRPLLQLAAAVRRLLDDPRFLLAQLGLSSLVVVGLAAQLYCALCSLGLSLPLGQATQVFPLMLLAMTVPVSFAGFGPREAVTAQLYSALQLSAADGAAFAMATGAVMLCSSLPCLLLVLCIPQASVERTP